MFEKRYDFENLKLFLILSSVDTNWKLYLAIALLIAGILVIVIIISVCCKMKAKKRRLADAVKNEAKGLQQPPQIPSSPTSLSTEITQV